MAKKRFRVVEGTQASTYSNNAGRFYVEHDEIFISKIGWGYTLKIARSICSLLNQGFSMETAKRETMRSQKLKRLD